MNNPWEEISLSDYENHMKLDTVMQLQAMNKMMKAQFYSYPVKSVMILGVAGGNGLEHINPQEFDKVYGVDINRDYLIECEKRYPQLKDVMEFLCVDLTDKNTVLPKVDLLIANLLVEYIGYQCFVEIIKKTNPHYISCIIQINTDDSFVSDSPYIHTFDSLNSVHHQIDKENLSKALDTVNYRRVAEAEGILPNGKKLVQLDFDFLDKP